MNRRQKVRTILIASPGLILAALGLAHPRLLDAGTAQWWSALHIVLLPMFPLLGAALWVLLDDAEAWLRRTGRLAAFAYAVYYTGLDAVAGIAAGAVVHAQGVRGQADAVLFDIGGGLEHAGAWAFLAACVAVVVAIASKVGWRSLPGAVLLIGAGVSFLNSHVFWPRGVFTMVAIGIASALLEIAVVTGRSSTSPAPIGGEPGV